jgi:hypothetical protein
MGTASDYLILGRRGYNEVVRGYYALKPQDRVSLATLNS